MYRDIPDDLKEMIEPVVEDRGCELMNIESVHGAGPTLLRITIDSPSGDGRVPVDRLAEIAREVETHLDMHDAMSAEYRLEVSSPGLDRMLAREKDFDAVIGTEVKLRTRRPLDGRRRFRGVLSDYQDGVVRIAVGGHDVEIAFEDIEKANTVYAFSSADFQGNTGGAGVLPSGRAAGGRKDD
ncbi:MAG: ribosome maturation factor RimP [Deltaproteobacteria bacterium]|nr:ribosome maturation factor RimP [Deltaproteobacteria bacterium]MBW2382160.1 ribosome maturation factor RimP [Deltaproteobacteria bacterium]MBW2697399.1 ribosome maturation factor RimP [Deltaproteobacteria bacterium]